LTIPNESNDQAHHTQAETAPRDSDATSKSGGIRPGATGLGNKKGSTSYFPQRNRHNKGHVRRKKMIFDRHDNEFIYELELNVRERLIVAESDDRRRVRRRTAPRGLIDPDDQRQRVKAPL